MVLNGLGDRPTRPSPFCPGVGAARGGVRVTAHFDSRRGGRSGSTPKIGPQPRGTLFPVVVPRFSSRYSRPSPSRPAMETRGGGCATSPHRTPPPGIRRSRRIKGAEWWRRLSSVILHRSCGSWIRPSLSHPTMDEPGAGALPRRFRLSAGREGAIDTTRRHKTTEKTLSRGFVALLNALGL